MTEFVHLPDRAVIEITGEDKDSFLQAIISNDIAKATAAQAIYTCLLTPQGKFLFDFFILRHEYRFFLDVIASRAAELIRKLSMYKLRSKVEIKDISGEWEVAAIVKEAPAVLTASADGVIYPDPRSRDMGARVFARKDKLPAVLPGGARELPRADYDKARINLTIPEGIADLEVDKSYPLHFRMEELNAIDFNKGCYVGQEVTARTKHRGTIRRGLYKVTGESLPPAGTALMLGEKHAGDMCSSNRNMGLALMEIEYVAPGHVFDGAGKKVTLM